MRFSTIVATKKYQRLSIQTHLTKHGVICKNFLQKSSANGRVHFIQENLGDSIELRFSKQFSLEKNENKIRKKPILEQHEKQYCGFTRDIQNVGIIQWFPNSKEMSAFFFKMHNIYTIQTEGRGVIGHSRPVAYGPRNGQSCPA